MSSFIKSIVKEIKTVKSMIDIPELKRERDAVNKKLQSAREMQKSQQNILDHLYIINQTTHNLKSLEKVCYEQMPGELERAQSVIVHLNNCVKKAEEHIILNNENISKLEQELQRINDRLSAARAAV